MTTTGMKPRPSDDELFANAIHNIKSYPTLPSTIGATLFFEPTSTRHSNSFSSSSTTELKNLPHRLNSLRRHLEASVRNIPNQSPYNENYESLRLSLTAAVFASAPPTFLSSFHSLFMAILSSESLGSFDQDELYHSLRYLGWIPHKISVPLCEALHETILNHVSQKISSEFEEEHLLPKIMNWKNQIITPWLHRLFDNDQTNFFELADWERKLDYAVSECFCQVRINEIFDIVAEFPDSLPAVKELKIALDRTQMQNKLKLQLRTSLVKRLIHPGANTSQIIDVYINTIKVLRVIDPSDGLLEAVAPPVRSYLRSRSDTIRCIVTSLTSSEEDGGDLYVELRRQDARPLENSPLDSDDEDEFPDPNWVPASTQSNHTSRGGTGDILSMLVGVYGSKELFVNEYRVMLADKLLSNLDYNTNREVQNLELLKLRFGELSMRQCEVMIKDIDDSKRIITNIHSTLKNKKNHKLNKYKKQNIHLSTSAIPDPIVDAAIISHIFWPTLQKDAFVMHPRIRSQLDQFSMEYAKLKNPRRLEWLPQIGTVQLELDIEEEVAGNNSSKEVKIVKKEFTCSPVHATLITHFETKNTWTLDDLAEEMEMTEDSLRQKMMFWIHQKVIEYKATNNTIVYQLKTLQQESDENIDNQPDMMGLNMEEEDEDNEQTLTVGVEDKEAMQVYESYVIGMLANLGKLPLERIHNMLKMFVVGSDHKYDKSPQQLSSFLQKLAKEDKIECGVDGLYSLVKNT